jgi:hypothetical protein
LVTAAGGFGVGVGAGSTVSPDGEHFDISKVRVSTTKNFIVFFIVFIIYFKFIST